MSYEVTNEQLRDHFKDALADADALVKATADLGGEALVGVRTKALESLRIAKAKLGETQDAMVQKARGAANATDAYVRDSPWEAIGVAAGVGVLVGVLLARR
jgi:ElaB/YqjD/DUF883 family membrane-anchored ribosome-binding protein